MERAISCVQAQHGLLLDPAAALKLAAGLDIAKVTASDLYSRALNANLCDCTLPGQLQRDLGSQQAATVRSTALLQIQTSRDATQPLRPCADMEDAEALLGAANQRTTSHRLLRLTLTDGHVEVPAVELKTLKAFRGIPIPGEKIVVKEGCEVRNGMIIMTDEHVKHVGGFVEQLRQEFLFRKGRAGVAYKHIAGLDGAPKFAPFGRTAASGLGERQQAVPRQPPSHPKSRTEAESYRGRGDQGRGRAGDRRQGPPRHFDSAVPKEVVPQYHDDEECW